MRTELTLEEFKEAKEKKSWIYHLPPPPNRIKHRKPRRGKVIIIYNKIMEVQET